MTDNTRKRTISYYRAHWPSGQNYTLQEILEISLGVLPNENTTTLPFLDGKARIKNRKRTDRGLFLHLVAWTDRQKASTVPHSGKTLSLVKAGNDWDFLTRNGMMMIYKDHCLMASGLNIRSASMRNYLIDIINHAREKGRSGTQRGDSNFGLSLIESSEIVERIYREGGVKRIEFGIGRYAHTHTTHSLENHNKIRWMIESVTEMFRGRRSTDFLPEEGDLNMVLVASIGKGRRSSLKYERLTAVAREMRDAGIDGHMIFETKSGMRVKYGDLVLKESFEIKKTGNTVDHEDAWDKMYSYFRKLRIDECLE